LEIKDMSFPGVISKNPMKYYWPIAILLPKAYTASTNGASIDRYRNGGYAALTLLFMPGLWTDGTHAFTIQESSDNATWTTVAAADLLPGPEVGVYGTASTFLPLNAASSVVQRIDYIGRQRYVRVISAEAGTTTGAVYALYGLLFAPNIFPAA
jgi:hypothetical protein